GSRKVGLIRGPMPARDELNIIRVLPSPFSPCPMLLLKGTMHSHSSTAPASTETLAAGSSAATVHARARFLKWVALTMGVLFLLAITGLWIVNRELPTFIERELNAHVDG